jgi:hypothetical protein
VIKNHIIIWVFTLFVVHELVHHIDLLEIRLVGLLPHTCVCMFVCMYVCMYVYMCVICVLYVCYMCIYVCYMCVYTCLTSSTHTHTHLDVWSRTI